METPNCIDEAKALDAQMRRHGCNIAELALRIGKSDRYVYAMLQLLELSPPVITLLKEGILQASHGFLLCRLTVDEQNRVVNACIESDSVCSTREMSNYIKRNLHVETAMDEIKVGQIWLSNDGSGRKLRIKRYVPAARIVFWSLASKPVGSQHRKGKMDVKRLRAGYEPEGVATREEERELLAPPSVAVEPQKAEVVDLKTIHEDLQCLARMQAKLIEVMRSTHDLLAIGFKREA